jgi:hypothetical protein
MDLFVLLLDLLWMNNMAGYIFIRELNFLMIIYLCANIYFLYFIFELLLN